MLLGIAIILTGGIFIVRQLVLRWTNLATESSLLIIFVQIGFAITVLGFFYGLIVDARTTDANQG
ncbi:hypothetical protein [Halorubellus salinus]|uniref:hypothetical protein n=1 Tax=Halorubellus salinus TaxID=755309 RepID=UPI001D08A33F|nr:hypothetical protein [Halorubellus salinus]